jgi:hypothetical protein
VRKAEIPSHALGGAGQQGTELSDARFIDMRRKVKKVV